MTDASDAGKNPARSGEARRSHYIIISIMGLPALFPDAWVCETLLSRDLVWVWLSVCAPARLPLPRQSPYDYKKCSMCPPFRSMLSGLAWASQSWISIFRLSLSAELRCRKACQYPAPELILGKLEGQGNGFFQCGNRRVEIGHSILDQGQDEQKMRVIPG